MASYGFFDDSHREYVITRPDTPLPWINYLGSEAYFGLISNTAGGYSFYRDARLRRITRYRYNNVPLDCGGRYLYLRDDDTGRVLVPHLAAHAPRAGQLHLPPRPGLYGHRLHLQRDQGRDPVLCAARREPGDLAAHPDQPPQGPGPAVGLFRRSSSACGMPGRRHQLSAQLQHRRGGGGRQRDLPQDRVPRAPQPFRLFCLLRAAGRL